MRALSRFCCFLHGVVGRFLNGHSFSKFSASLSTLGCGLCFFQGFSFGVQFLHFLEVFPLVFALVLSLFKFSLKAFHGSREGLNGIGTNWTASSVKLLRLLGLTGTHGLLCLTNDLVGLFSLLLLLTDHLVHLVSEVALFAHLYDELPNLVVEFVSG